MKPTRPLIQLTSPVNLNARVHPQFWSPLFTVLPSEIREKIFLFVVTAYPNMSEAYPFDSYWYRPNHIAPMQTSLSLLGTCKRVYAEAKVLVWEDGNGNDEQSFWLGDTTRGPPVTDEWRLPMEKVRRVHIYPRVDATGALGYNGQFFREGRPATLLPSEVTMTVRYTDWPQWEENGPLRLNRGNASSWTAYFPWSVQTFKLELESAAHKEGELKALVDEITNGRKEWKWRRNDGVFLELDDSEGVKEWDWMGTTVFDGKSCDHHPKGPTMRYVVKALTFRPSNREKETPRAVSRQRVKLKPTWTFSLTSSGMRRR